MQTVGSGLIMADAHSTVVCQGLGIHETNPLLGHWPSTSRIYVTLGLEAVAYNYAIQKLPRRYARLLGLATLAVEGYTLRSNWRMIHRTRAPY